eukprot:EG_transcript_1175
MEWLHGIDIAIHRGRLLVGTPLRRHFLRLTFSSAKGVHHVTNTSTEDLYRSVSSFHFQGLCLDFVLNAKVRQDSVERPPAPAGRAWAFRIRPAEAVRTGFGVLAKELRFNTWGVGQESFDLQERAPSQDEDTVLLPTGLEGAAGDNGVDDAAAQAVAKAFGPVLANAQAHVTFYVDQPGLETTQRPRAPDTLPKWGAEVQLLADHISYGPWANFQRDQLQKFFLPKTFTNLSLYRAVVGAPRPFGSFQFHLGFLAEKTTVTIPFRHKSPSPAAPQGFVWDGRDGSLSLTFAKGSSVTFQQPGVAVAETVTSRVLVTLLDLSLVTTLNGAPLLTCSPLEVLVEMQSGLQWTARQDWNVGVRAYHAELWPLRDHVDFLVDLKDDWAHVPQMYGGHPLATPSLQDLLTTWVPVHYLYKLQFVEGVCIHLSCNPHNAISSHTDATKNDYIVLSAASLEQTITAPALRCPVLQANDRTTSFDLLFREVRARLCVRADHPLWPTLPAEDEAGPVFLSVRRAHIRITQHQQAPSACAPEPRPDGLQDSVAVALDWDDAALAVEAPYVAGLVAWWRNYFGVSKRATSPAQMRETAGRLGRMANVGDRLRNFLQREIPTNLSDTFVDMVVRNAAFVLGPSVTARDDSPALRCQELTLSCHSSADLLDLSVSCSPLELRIPALGLATGGAGCSGITLHLVTYYHDRCAYHRRRMLNIGSLTGQLHVRQLVLLEAWLRAQPALSALRHPLEADLSLLARHHCTPSAATPAKQRSQSVCVVAPAPWTVLPAGVEAEDFRAYLEALEEREASSEEFAFQLTQVRVLPVNVVLRGPGGCVAVGLPRGLRFEQNSLNDTTTLARATLCLPAVRLRALEAKREHLMAADTPGDHLEIGGLGFGLKVHVTGTEPGVDVHFECQRAFLLSRDEATRRLQHIDFDEIVSSAAVLACNLPGGDHRVPAAVTALAAVALLAATCAAGDGRAGGRPGGRRPSVPRTPSSSALRPGGGRRPFP